MKKLTFVLAAAGLMTLAACGSKTPAENVSDNTSAALENTADNLDAAADNATTAMGENALSNAADNAHNAADAAEAAGDNNMAVNAAQANAMANGSATMGVVKKK